MTASKPSRRFPPPWRVVELPGGYAVEDANGQRLGTFYGRADPHTARLAGVLILHQGPYQTANNAIASLCVLCSIQNRPASLPRRRDF
jgi:hypothetical protein